MTVCYDCQSRLKKNEGVRIRVYGNMGIEYRRICDRCNMYRSSGDYYISKYKEVKKCQHHQIKPYFI